MSSFFKHRQSVIQKLKCSLELWLLALQPSCLKLHCHHLHLQKSGHQHALWTWYDMFCWNVNVECSLWNLQMWAYQWFAEPTVYPGDWAARSVIPSKTGKTRSLSTNSMISNIWYWWSKHKTMKTSSCPKVHFYSYPITSLSWCLCCCSFNS